MLTPLILLLIHAATPQTTGPPVAPAHELNWSSASTLIRQQPALRVRGRSAWLASWATPAPTMDQAGRLGTWTYYFGRPTWNYYYAWRGLWFHGWQVHGW